MYSSDATAVRGHLNDVATRERLVAGLSLGVFGHKRGGDAHGNAEGYHRLRCVDVTWCAGLREMAGAPVPIKQRATGRRWWLSALCECALATRPKRLRCSSWHEHSRLWWPGCYVPPADVQPQDWRRDQGCGSRGHVETSEERRSFLCQQPLLPA